MCVMLILFFSVYQVVSSSFLLVGLMSLMVVSLGSNFSSDVFKEVVDASGLGGSLLTGVSTSSFMRRL